MLSVPMTQSTMLKTYWTVPHYQIQRTRQSFASQSNTQLVIFLRIINCLLICLIMFLLSSLPGGIGEYYKNWCFNSTRHRYCLLNPSTRFQSQNQELVLAKKESCPASIVYQSLTHSCDDAVGCEIQSDGADLCKGAI